MVKLNKSKFFTMAVLIFLLLGLNCLFAVQQPWFTTTTENQFLFLNTKIPQSRPPSQKVTSPQSYIERGPITIGSDFQLNNSGFPGNGTIDDPIRIEGYNITASSGNLISIIGTTYYFRIANCLLNGLTTNDWGIYFDDVVNATIENNRIMNTGSDGIGLYSSKYNSIINNTISNNDSNVMGIRLEAQSSFNILENNTLSGFDAGITILISSHNNTVINNTVFDHNSGIWIYGDESSPSEGSKNNTVVNNTIFNNGNGINIQWESNNNILAYNSIRNNIGEGIFLESSKGNTIVKNTVYDNFGTGIFLFQSNKNEVSHNSIHDNGGFNNGDGITLVSAINNTIIDNTVFGNGFAEISLSLSENNTLSNNIIFNSTSATGIYIVTNSSYNTIFNNTVYNTAGIALEYAANFNILINNSIYDNEGAGIGLQYSTNNTIMFNSIRGNQGGVSIANGNELGVSWYNIISYNVIYSNNQYGVGFDSLTEKNTIIRNDFKDNFGWQAMDEGTSNFFINNYWSDWSGTDPYSIEGSAGNDDPSPLLNPYHLSVPIITAPTYENLTLAGNVFIQWDASVDTFGHSLNYSVFYSTNDGGSWTTLASGLTASNYTFDTTTIAEGTKVFLKVHALDSIGFVAKTVSETFFIINGPSIPTISSPNGGETLSGIVSIEWGASIDAFNHTVTYSVYYSSNNGATWTQLASGLTVTNYTWNTIAVPNGFSNLIKVVTTCSKGITAVDISDATFAIQNAIATSTTTSIASTSPTSQSIPGMSGFILILALVSLITVKKRENK